MAVKRKLKRCIGNISIKRGGEEKMKAKNMIRDNKVMEM
jgi:hypothetical protein